MIYVSIEAVVISHFMGRDTHLPFDSVVPTAFIRKNCRCGQK